jgi:hypothetical protein
VSILLTIYFHIAETCLNSRRYHKPPASSVNSDIRRGLQYICVGNHTTYMHSEVQPIPITVLSGELLWLSNIWLLLWLAYSSGYTSSGPHYHLGAEFSFPRGPPTEATEKSSYFREKRPEDVQSAPTKVSQEHRCSCTAREISFLNSLDASHRPEVTIS